MHFDSHVTPRITKPLSVFTDSMFSSFSALNANLDNRIKSDGLGRAHVFSGAF